MNIRVKELSVLVPIAHRPRCHWCDRPLRPEVFTAMVLGHVGIEDLPVTIGDCPYYRRDRVLRIENRERNEYHIIRYWTGRYQGYGRDPTTNHPLFCRLWHCELFAERAAVLAGLRMKRKP